MLLLLPEYQYVAGTLHTLFHLILTGSLTDKHYHLHVGDENAEARRS